MINFGANFRIEHWAYIGQFLDSIGQFLVTLLLLSTSGFEKCLILFFAPQNVKYILASLSRVLSNVAPEHPITKRVFEKLDELIILKFS
jgi:hypothetical protein